MEMDDEMDMDNDMDMDMSMSMCFGCNTDVYPIYVVFKGWKVNDNKDYFLACVALVLLTIFYRFLLMADNDYHHYYLQTLHEKQKAAAEESSHTSASDGNNNHLPLNTPPSPGLSMPLTTGSKKNNGEGNIVQVSFYLLGLKCSASLLRTISYALSLFLMLVAMTYNLGLVFALFGGYFIGEALFGDSPLIFKKGSFHLLFRETSKIKSVPIDCCN